MYVCMNECLCRNTATGTGSDDLTVPATAADDESSPGASDEAYIHTFIHSFNACRHVSLVWQEEGEDEGFGYADQKETLAIQLEHVRSTPAKLSPGPGSGPGPQPETGIGIGIGTGTGGPTSGERDRRSRGPTTCAELFQQLG